MTKTIAVIDGNSLMHRAYHAIQTPMMAPDGTPTNAIFGFLQMFCKFVEETDPDAIVCAFDTGKPVARLQALPEYKAHRPHMDDELRVQFPIIEQLLKSMDVPVVKLDGWEGDDILGTIAARDEALGYKTLLVTGDKDACQLATDLTSIVNTKKGISDVLVLDPQGVMEKYGVSPSQFVDYLGLMGDSSDNIPGVPGIGPKTAQTLIEKYGSIEGIYEHIGELKGKQRENLENNKDVAFLSREIATIVCDLDIDIDLEQISFPSFEVSAVEENFKQYALAAPLARVLTLSDCAMSSCMLDISVGDLTQGDTAFKLLDEAIASSLEIGIAFEYDQVQSLFESNFTCIFSLQNNYVVLHNSDAQTYLKRALNNPNSSVYDLKAAMHVLAPIDSSEDAKATESELASFKAFDIELAAYLIDSQSSDYSFEKLAEKYLRGPINIKDDSEVLVISATVARMLHKVLSDKLADSNSADIYNDIDYPLVSVLANMERTGVSLDIDKLSLLRDESTAELESLATQIYEIAGEEFNIDSPKQLGVVLFEKMGIPPIKKNKTGAYSTDATVLRELAKTEEIATLVINYREYAKIKSTYIDALPKMQAGDGRVHTNFHQTVTATGRLSSSNPNLQNIPVRTEFGRRIRECFVALDENSVFMSADYSQIELRLLAHLSEDVGLINAFNSGVDFHTSTASSIFNVATSEVTSEMRSRAKAVNFGIVYGQQAFGLAQTLDISRAEAKDIIDAYYSAYHQVRIYLDSVVDRARESGKASTMFGRVRHIPELRASNKQLQGFGERTAMNHPMQGSAADIIKLAMIAVQKRLQAENLKSKMLLQVHDELDLSVQKDEIETVSTLLKEEMESVCSLKVPLLVEIGWGSDWASAH